MSVGGISKLRLALFLMILAFMALGPFYRQVLGGKNPLFRHWVMFRGKGVGIVDATFFQVLSDGREIPLNRRKVLGIPEGGKTPESIKKIQGHSGTLALVNALCKTLGPGADVRVRSRVATRLGWKAGFNGKENLCPLARRQGPYPGRSR